MATEKQDKPGKSPARHPLMYGFSVFILLVIAVTFVGAPVISSQFGNQTRVVFGTYNGKEIAFSPGNYFSRQKDAYAARVAESGHDENIQWVAYRVWQSAFQTTALHMALLDKASQSGLDVSEENLDKTLATYGPYVRDGKFDKELYRQKSNREKMETRKLFREDLIQNQIMTDLQYGNRFSSKEIGFIKEMARERRSFDIMVITPESFPDSKVIEYASENSSLFRKGNFARITIKSSADAARNILDRLKQAPSVFEEIAKTQSKDDYAERGGAMGPMFYYNFSTAFDSADTAETIFNLKKDELSEVIETPFGWTIYKCIEPSELPDWQTPSVISVVRSYIERYEKGRLEDFLIDIADNTRNRAIATSFPEAANEGGYVHFATDEFGINYGNIELFAPVPEGENSLLSGASYNEDLFKALFSLNTGDVSMPVLVGENVIIAKALTLVELSDEELDIIDFYYPMIVQQYQDQELQRSILESDRLVDNFDEKFKQFFMSN